MAVSGLPFYLTLPSDASMQLFPGNTAAEWVTKLHSPVSLHGSWEVALVELLYSHSIYNLPDAQSIIVRQISDLSVPITKGENPTFTYAPDHVIVVPAGIYSAKELINCIEGQIPMALPWGQDLKLLPTEELIANNFAARAALFPAFEMSFIPSERKTRIRFRNLRIKLHFPVESTHLRRMLGFTDSHVQPTDSPGYVQRIQRLSKSSLEQPQPALPESFFEPDQLAAQLYFLLKQKTDLPGDGLELRFDVISPKVINTLYGNQYLFIYSDILDFCVVGDTVAQLLRSVPIRGDTAFQMVMEKFDQGHYMPVIRNFFENIRISIASDLGDLAKFQSGKSLVKLHFRPAKYC